MIIQDWATFRRSFGFFASQSVATGNVTIEGNASPANDRVLRASNNWFDDAFAVPTGLATAWLTMTGTEPYIESMQVDDGGSFTDLSTAAMTPSSVFTLLPSTPAVNDAAYFGSSRVFDTLTIEVTQGDGVWVIAWEYWDGTQWSSLDFAIPPSGAALSDGGVFTNETEDAGSATTADVTLLPASGAYVVGDAFYIGSSYRFSAVEFVITTNAAAEVWAITWEYWDGSAWSALSGVADGTSGLKTQGTSRLAFTQPTDWAVVEPDAVVPGSFYYVRGRVTTGSSPTVRPLATTVSPLLLVSDATQGFTNVATSDVAFGMPDDWIVTSVNGSADYYYVRARVSSYTSVVQGPRADVVTLPGANDGEYPIESIAANALTIDNDDHDYVPRLIDESQSAGVVSFSLRHIDDGDGVDRWQLEKVRETGSGFGDAGSTMTGVAAPVSVAGGSDLTANAGASDAAAYTDDYDWFVSQQTQVHASRFLDVSEVTESDGLTPISGTINIAASAVAVSEFTIDAAGFTAEQLANVYRDSYAYVMRLSDGAIQLLDLTGAVLGDE